MKSWRTTLTGIAGSVLYGAAALLQQGNLNWKDYVLMATLTVATALAKDSQVTGGTVTQ